MITQGQSPGVELPKMKRPPPVLDDNLWDEITTEVKRKSMHEPASGVEESDDAEDATAAGASEEPAHDPSAEGPAPKQEAADSEESVDALANQIKGVDIGAAGAGGDDDDDDEDEDFLAAAGAVPAGGIGGGGAGAAGGGPRDDNAKFRIPDGENPWDHFIEALQEQGGTATSVTRGQMEQMMSLTSHNFGWAAILTLIREQSGRPDAQMMKTLVAALRSKYAVR